MILDNVSEKTPAINGLADRLLSTAVFIPDRDTQGSVVKLSLIIPGAKGLHCPVLLLVGYDGELLRMGA